MNVNQLAEKLRFDPLFMQNVVRWDKFPAKAAAYAPFPDTMDARLKEVRAKRGIHQLYTHQASAIQHVLQG